MNTKENPTMYETIPVVSEMNKVPGFNPLKFLRKSEDGPKLDLKYKKLWFRLKYPAGRTGLTALRITDQLAIIEAKVYFDKNDPAPSSSFIATKYADKTPGGMYIQAAQYEAMDTALSDAGFGVQFTNAKPEDGAAPVSILKSAASPEETAAPEQRPAPAAEAAAVTEQAASEMAEPAETLTEEALPEAQTTADSQTTVPVQEAAVETEPQNEWKNTESAAMMDAAPTQEEAICESLPEPPVETAAAFTPDLPVDVLCAAMTLEDAGNVIVPVGTCKGWTLSQVADRRPASLKWYLNGYNGDDNMLRAGAWLLLEANKEKAS